MENNTDLEHIRTAVAEYFKSEQDLFTLSGMLSHVGISSSDILSIRDSKIRTKLINYIKAKLMAKNQSATAKMLEIILGEFEEKIGYAPTDEETTVFIVKNVNITYDDWLRLSEEKYGKKEEN